MDQRLHSSWWALRIALGVAPFLAGLDKFFNLLTKWTMYLNPLVLRVVPVGPGTFMRAVNQTHPNAYKDIARCFVPPKRPCGFSW